MCPERDQGLNGGSHVRSPTRIQPDQEVGSRASLFWPPAALNAQI